MDFYHLYPSSVMVQMLCGGVQVLPDQTERISHHMEDRESPTTGVGPNQGTIITTHLPKPYEEMHHLEEASGFHRRIGTFT